MDTPRERFDRWFTDVLRALYTIRNSGFAPVMVSLPLLERYLRERSGVHEKASLDDRFHTELNRIFPELPDLNTARKFWKTFRHGLLHQVAFSAEMQGGDGKRLGGLSNECDAIQVSPDGHFWVNPGKFSDRVVNVIQGDFSTFVGVHSQNHSFPTVGTHQTIGLGTSSPEMWKDQAFRDFNKKR